MGQPVPDIASLYRNLCPMGAVPPGPSPPVPINSGERGGLPRMSLNSTTIIFEAQPDQEGPKVPMG